MATVTGSGAAMKGEPEKKQAWLRPVGVAWVALAVVYFLWEAWSYTGLFARLSEWQFGSFRQSWPAVTFLALALLFAVPGLVAVVLGARRKEEDHELTTAEEQDRLLAKSIRFGRILTYLASGFAIASLVSLAGILTLPGSGGQQQEITVGAPGSTQPSNGSARLTGRVVFERTATLGQDLILTDKQARFAPMLPASGEGPVQYFVQLAPYEGTGDRPGDPVMSVSGILMHDALPGAIETLYRNAGVAMAAKPYVLYRYQGTMRRPYYLAAFQTGCIAVVLFLLALVQRRHVRKLAGQNAPAASLTATK